MQRYFVPEKSWKEQEVIIEEDARHISKVMRMKPEDDIICVHPDKKAALCKIIDIDDDKVTASILAWLEEERDLPVNVTIAQGLPKADKLELILQKGTELGATAFLPFQAERSIVKWDRKKAAKKEDRFSKIVKEASEQSHRTSIPEIHSISGFETLLEKSAGYDVCLFAYEEEAKGERSKGLGELLKETSPGMTILACIGPEGGFTMEEADALKEHGFHSVRLGPRILRTETAPLYLLSSISYHFEELRC